MHLVSKETQYVSKADVTLNNIIYLQKYRHLSEMNYSNIFLGTDSPCGTKLLKKIVCHLSYNIVYITSALAHQLRIPEILPWDRKSYLTYAILPM